MQQIIEIIRLSQNNWFRISVHNYNLSVIILISQCSIQVAITVDSIKQILLQTVLKWQLKID